MATFGEKENAINAYIFMKTKCHTVCKNIPLLMFISLKNNLQIICVPKQN